MSNTIGSNSRITFPFAPNKGASFFQNAYPNSPVSLLTSSSQPFDQLAKSAATGIASFLKSSLNVQNSAKSLIGSNSSALQSRSVATSDKTVITGAAANSASLQSYKINVSAVASSQKNSGFALAKADDSVINSGSNQFKISIGGKSTTITASISASDTNEGALTKLKNAINDAKTGVTASIVTDSDNGTKKLELTSDKTGTDSAFSVSDVSGNAAAAAGIGTETTAASNAVYSVNGGAAQTSQSNTISLDKGKVAATLHKTSGDSVQLDVRPNEDNAVKQVKQLIADYNIAHDRLNEAGGYLNTSVKKGLERAVSTTEFEQIGIKKSSDGTLKLDEAKFKESLSSNYEQTNKAITGRYGLGNSISSAVDRFNAVPASSLLSSKVQSYGQYATYQASLQTSTLLPTSGLLFNGLF